MITESMERLSDSLKCCGRKVHPDDIVVEIPVEKGVPIRIGGGNFCMIAGPCAVEDEFQIESAAIAVKAAGAQLLRGGAFKPRTSPYSFPGLGDCGMEMLKAAKAASGLPVVSEIMSPADLCLFDDVDVLQVGARNMQNFQLLRALGRTDKPVLLKRGFGATLTELLMSAEYIMSEGNSKVILCERGIRTFNSYTRNTLDLAAVPMLKKMCCLPVIVDPSHGTGVAELVSPMALAAVAAGADGLMIEVHDNPEAALSDGKQALRPEEFGDLVQKINRLRRVL